MVSIGWLQDRESIIGGSELSCSRLIETAPADIEVVRCPPNKRPPRNVAAFVVQNCTTYTQRWIEELAVHPVIKQVRDPWYAGDAVLRRWILDHAVLVTFSSTVHLATFGYNVNAPHKIMPPPLDLTPFREAALPRAERSGNIFVGRLDPYKGVPALIDHALSEHLELDCYGDPYMSFGKLPLNIKLHGQAPYELMPQIMGKADTLYFWPEWPEAFGRVVAEAWAAGCFLEVRGKVGAMEWIGHKEDEIEQGSSMFWNAVQEVIA